MKKEEVRELMKDKFDEISEHQYASVDNVGECRINTLEGYLFFKPKQKFPIIFKGKYFNFELTENGYINQEQFESVKWLHHRLDKKDIEAFLKVVEKSKELRKWILD